MDATDTDREGREPKALDTEPHDPTLVGELQENPYDAPLKQQIDETLIEGVLK